MFKLELEGCYWLKNSVSAPVIFDKGGKIVIHNYDSFEARYFCPKNKLWNTLNYENLEILDEINEKSYDKNILKLAGTSKVTGYWIEYLIKTKNCEIIFL